MFSALRPRVAFTQIHVGVELHLQKVPDTIEEIPILEDDYRPHLPVAPREPEKRFLKASGRSKSWIHNQRRRNKIRWTHRTGAHISYTGKKSLRIFLHAARHRLLEFRVPGTAMPSSTWINRVCQIPRAHQQYDRVGSPQLLTSTLKSTTAQGRSCRVKTSRWGFGSLHHSRNIRFTSFCSRLCSSPGWQSWSRSSWCAQLPPRPSTWCAAETAFGFCSALLFACLFFVSIICGRDEGCFQNFYGPRDRVISSCGTFP